MKRFFLNLVIGFFSLYLAVLFVPGVRVEGDFGNQIKVLFFAGICLGLANFFLKPLFNIIAIPLRIITFGFVGLIINMAIIWLTNIFFPKMIIEGFGALFWTGLIVWLLNSLLLIGSKR